MEKILIVTSLIVTALTVYVAYQLVKEFRLPGKLDANGNWVQNQ